jgi:hypothetical protein
MPEELKVIETYLVAVLDEILGVGAGDTHDREATTNAIEVWNGAYDR